MAHVLFLLKVAKAACQLYNLWKRGQHDEMQRQLSQIPSCNAALAQSECKVQESEDCFADDAVSDEEVNTYSLRHDSIQTQSRVET